ncbi:MAG: 30S ribosome-binding factor RbfA [Planctomycetes bacterium]|jgi:ribosome-binding factor A|nr:30S ribosome-binding factor RbfA [Planctomycetota bacterium]
MNDRRIARLQEQIKQRLAEVLQREIADPKLGLVTITRVELDAEFTLCKAYWSVLAPTSIGEQKARRESQEVLDRARGFVQREVGKALHTRTIPHLEFVHDEGIAGAIRVNTLLKDLAEEQAKKPPPPAEPEPGA